MTGSSSDGARPKPQQGAHYVFTSTQVGDVASLDIAWVWDMAMDPIGGDVPIPRRQVAVAPTARVYEIQELDDWRELVRLYSRQHVDTEADRSLRRQNSAYDWAWREVTPDRSAASRDWDGIHLTFGGVLLTTAIADTVPNGWL